MKLSEELRAGLDIALNEADFCDIRINERGGEVRLLMVVLTLPRDGPAPEDTRTVLSCTGVSRIVASLREGRWDDATAEVVPLRLAELPSTVRSFGSQPVYGWEFIDAPASRRPVWRDRASLDFSVGRGRGEHSIDLFQASIGEGHRHLDLRIEFDDLAVTDADDRTVPLEDFAAGGRRWWAALEAGDARTEGHGISPLGSRTDEEQA
ncbi:MAG: hypothetical protein ACYCSF_05430 [Acidimicrobiales bacterium]